MLLMVLGAMPLQAEAQAGEALCRGCNVIVVVVDTLRADALGLYGYPRATSPHMDRLGEKSAVFLNAFSHAPFSLPSQMSILTSLHPESHRVEVPARDTLDPRLETAGVWFQKAGYRTIWAADPTNRQLDLRAGFDRGFGVVCAPEARYGWKEAFQCLERLRDRRFFMYLHDNGPHEPYTPEEASILRFAPSVRRGKSISWDDLNDLVRTKVLADPALVLHPEAIAKRPEVFKLPDGDEKWKRIKRLSRNPNLTHTSRWKIGTQVFWSRFDEEKTEDLFYLRTLYDALVFEADQRIGELLRTLERLGLKKNTLLVVTADHGEAFLEHGRLQHSQLYRESLHVPLIFSFPNGKPAGRFPDLARSIDILPTLLQIVGLPPPAQAEGRSLLPVMRGAKNDALYYAFAQWGGAYAIRDIRYTFIVEEDGREALYDRRADPQEQTSILKRSPRVVERFRRRLSAYRVAGADDRSASWPAQVKPETRKKLRETGYW